MAMNTGVYPVYENKFKAALHDSRWWSAPENFL